MTFQVSRDYKASRLSDDAPQWVKDYSIYTCIFSNDEIALLQNKKQGYETVRHNTLGKEYQPCV